MSDLQPRSPGWKLIAGTDGPHGWHLVDQAIEFGGVRAVCGLRGRVITENQRLIVPCEHCADGVVR